VRAESRAARSPPDRRQREIQLELRARIRWQRRSGECMEAFHERGPAIGRQHEPMPRHGAVAREEIAGRNTESLSQVETGDASGRNPDHSPTSAPRPRVRPVRSTVAERPIRDVDGHAPRTRPLRQDAEISPIAASAVRDDVACQRTAGEVGPRRADLDRRRVRRASYVISSAAAAAGYTTRPGRVDPRRRGIGECLQVGLDALGTGGPEPGRQSRRGATRSRCMPAGAAPMATSEPTPITFAPGVALRIDVCAKTEGSTGTPIAASSARCSLGDRESILSVVALGATRIGEREHARAPPTRPQRPVHATEEISDELAACRRLQAR